MELSECRLCPRNCGADRLSGKKGYCHTAGGGVLLSRAALHYWEEPCISGTNGSGAVFFSGCNLRCVFCQNRPIRDAEIGREVTVARLKEIFLELQAKQAHNINLVTPTHYALQIAEAVRVARAAGLTVPVVYNTGGYEKAETLRAIEDTTDVFLTDFKYSDPVLAGRFSNAPDYPEIAKAALSEMVREKGGAVFDEAGLMTRGVIVRILLLPGHVKDACRTVDYLYDTYGGTVYMSLMRQYTPMGDFPDAPELSRSVTKREYDRLIDHVIAAGVTNAFIQEGGTAKESFIPAFDYEGV